MMSTRMKKINTTHISISLYYCFPSHQLINFNIHIPDKTAWHNMSLFNSHLKNFYTDKQLWSIIKSSQTISCVWMELMSKCPTFQRLTASINRNDVVTHHPLYSYLQLALAAKVLIWRHTNSEEWEESCKSPWCLWYPTCTVQKPAVTALSFCCFLYDPTSLKYAGKWTAVEMQPDLDCLFQWQAVRGSVQECTR